jgi:nuclear pore complex protein Nup98-Nup96
LFSQQGTQTAFGGTTTPSLFGSSPAASSGMFGTPGTSSSQSFGFTANQAQQLGAFGQAPTPAGGGSQPFGSGFPGGQVQTQGLWSPSPQQQQQQQQQNAQHVSQQAPQAAQPESIFPSNFNVVPPHMLEMHKRTAEIIKNLQEEVTKNRAWYPDSHGKTSTPTGLPSPNAGFNAPPPSYSSSVSSATWNSTRSPISGTKIQPRGHPWNTRDDNMPKAKMSDLGRGGSVHSRSPHMQLVVKPNSLAPPRLILNGKRIELPDKSGDGAMSPPKDSSVNSPVAGSSLTPLTATNTFTPPATTDTSRQQGVSPMPSPAATALYNQATMEEPNPISSPPAQSSVPSGLIPTSTKAGYECQPSSDDLAKLSEGDLAAVSNFVVRRPGFGEVAWEGAVDVRGVNLDEVVQIHHGSIAVYPDEIFSATKPPVGTKLNRPAILTFEEMYPRGGPRADADAMDAYEAKLRNWTKKMDAEFISYERGTGQWKIRTFHFSRYGVLDDSEDDEPMPTSRRPQTVKFAAGSTPAQKKGSIVRNQTPYAKPSNVVFDEVEVEDCEKDDTQMSDVDVLDTVKYNVEQTYNDVFGIAQRAFEATEAVRVHGLTSEMIVEEDVEEGIIDSQLLVKPDESLILEAKRMTSLIASLRPARSTINYGICQGKSMRGSWSPKGAVCVPGDIFGPASKTMRPIFNETITCLPSILRRLYSICKRDSKNGDECPLFYLPPSLQNGGDESSHTTLLEFLVFLGSSNLGNTEVQHSFMLLATLLETPGASTDMVPVEGRERAFYTFDERRNHALLRWLTSVNAAAADRKISEALAQKDLPAAIFAALSSGDIGKASKIAMDGGAIDLAVVLSTGQEGVSHLARMVSRLSTVGQPLPQELVRSLRVLCGQHSLEESLYRTGSDLSWQERLALLLLQYPYISMASLLAKYEDDVKDGLAPFPSPQYGDDKSNKAESLQFRILRALAKPGSVSILDIVSTDGFSLNTHDLSPSFLLATALSASGFATRGDCFKLELLTSGMEAQLIAQREYNLAIIVCLYSFGPPSKSTRFAKFHRARKHVLQFFHDDERSVPQLDFIPSAWKVDAMAYKADNVDAFINQLNKNEDCQEEAAVTMEQQVLPKLFFDNRVGSTAAYSNGTSMSVLNSLLRLDTLMSQLQSVGDAPGSAEAVLEECESIEEFFKSTLAQNVCLSPVPASSRVDYKHMLQEGIHRAGVLRFLASSSGLTGSK